MHRYCIFVFIGWMCLPAVGCRRSRVEDSPPIAVQTVALAREPVSSEVHYGATVREHQRIQLSFKVPGTVESLLQVLRSDGRVTDVHEGDIVTNDPSRPVAELDDSDYRRRMTGAQDQLARAEAKQRATEATVTAVRATYERIKAMHDRGSVSQQMYDDTLAKRDAANAELDAVAREVGAAGVAFQQAEDDWKHCKLIPPIPKAVVSRKYTERGERVQAGQPVFEIMDLSTMRAAFGVPDTRIDEFRLGQTVSVSADAFRGLPLVGRVTKILPAADLRTRTFEVEVTIDEPKELRPGMVVSIVVGRPHQMVLVPMTAVQRGDKPGELVVFVVTDEKGKQVARRRRVQLDGIYDNRIRLIEGPGSEIRKGDPVVVSGAFRLVDGQEVRVLDAPKSVTGAIP
ncbi:MAG: efflux RND transporter periplasmic adaptor subunit [Planctomycetaceae bacterium]|nr:efflux RND transporter periplasmic adaptor subunit [Planctomycetaceae bacterium]